MSTDDPDTITLSGDACMFPVGSIVVITGTEHRPWYKRAWIWFKVKVLRRPHPDHYIVTGITDSTTLTIDKHPPSEQAGEWTCE